MLITDGIALGDYLQSDILKGEDVLRVFSDCMDDLYLKVEEIEESYNEDMGNNAFKNTFKLKYYSDPTPVYVDISYK